MACAKMTSPVEDIALIARFWSYLHGKSVGISQDAPSSNTPIANRPEYIDNSAGLVTRAIAAERRLTLLEASGANGKTAANILRYVWLVCGEDIRAQSTTYAAVACYEDRRKLIRGEYTQAELRELVVAGIVRYQAAVDLWRSYDANNP